MTAYQIRSRTEPRLGALKHCVVVFAAPWQTLRKQAERIAAEEFFVEGSRVLYR